MAVGHEDLLREARGRLDEGCVALRSPTPASLERCEELLEQAVALAGKAFPAAGAETLPQGAADELAQLRRTLQRTARLLDSAAAYHHGWTRLVDAMCAGYGADGEPEQRVQTPCQVWAEG